MADKNAYEDHSSVVQLIRHSEADQTYLTYAAKNGPACRYSIQLLGSGLATALIPYHTRRRSMVESLNSDAMATSLHAELWRGACALYGTCSAAEVRVAACQPRSDYPEGSTGT